MQRVIGIDFGTSTTYMNVKRYNDGKPAEDQFSYMPVMFNYGESNGYVASIVRENADGTFDFGEKAMEELEGSTIFTEVKMRLESPDETEREETRRITRAFFKFLYDTYTQQSANLGSPDDTEETIVSYPVKWREETARFMLDAAREAGFQNVRGMDEATAAVSTVACQNSGSGLLCANKPGYLLLIDMGAGTTDLVVCKYLAPSGGGISVELVTSWPQDSGEPTFGGREIDGVLERYIEDYLTASLNPALAPMAHNFAAIPGQAKKWKELNVSVSLAANKPVTACGYIAAYGPMLKDKFPSFDRKGFEALIEGGLRDYARLIDGCLKKTAELDGDFAAAGLDLVILTGGHSAWYFAREIVDGTMEGWLEHGALAAVRREKHRVVSLPNPQTTVSLGLVYSKLPFRLAKQEPEKKGGKQAEKATEQKTERKEPGQGAEALYLLGKRFEEGDDVKQDYKKAAELYLKAAMYENAEAQCALGKCYEFGSGVKEDLEKAFYWYRKSAEQGNVMARERLDWNKKDWEQLAVTAVRQELALHPRITKGSGLFSEKTLDRLRVHLAVPSQAEVFLAHDDSFFHNGNNGFVLASTGIYCRPQFLRPPEFTSWEKFARLDLWRSKTGVFEIQLSDSSEICILCFSPEELNDDLMAFCEGLQRRLRAAARNAQAVFAPAAAGAAGTGTGAL